VTLATEDQLAIGQLYARQSQAIDSGDGAGWAASFTADGVFSSPTYDAPVVGAAALEDFADRFAAAATEAGLVRRHWTTGLALEPQADDRILGRCYAIVLATAPGEAPVIERSVVFNDQLVRRDGSWLVERRNVEVDGRGEGRSASEPFPKVPRSRCAIHNA
jgi:hypothetical protein